MNTKQIEYILTLYETRNFNRAAEQVYVSQPTMSYQIRQVEEEIGFKLFERSGKGASVTPAGEQFIITLRDIHSQLHKAIEQGQNFNTQYQDNIRIIMAIRSALYYLPDIMHDYETIAPAISITPSFDYHNPIESFLKGEQDLLLALYEDIKHIPDLTFHHLYDSRIYLVCRSDDPLAKKTLITQKDLEGRTLMIGGGSPAPLRALQQEIIKNPEISYFNSYDHDTSLTYVSSKKAIVLSPGFLNDHNSHFSWIPYDTKQVISCGLCTHTLDTRPIIKDFVTYTTTFYKNHLSNV